MSIIGRFNMKDELIQLILDMRSYMMFNPDSESNFDKWDAINVRIDSTLEILKVKGIKSDCISRTCLSDSERIRRHNASLRPVR